MNTTNTTPNAADSGQFTIGDITVNRLGYGAMRLTGPGIWGEPADRAECLRTLESLSSLGINFIDTADSYGPYVSEQLIGEARHTFPDALIATKAGLARSGPDKWEMLARPEYLRQCVLMSMRRLDVEQIGLWQLHRIDPKVSRDEQFGAIKELQREGLIRHVGLSEVSVADIKEAGKYFKVVTVQNIFNLVNRKHEDVLDYCTEHNIGFIPWFPLASGDLAKPGSVLDDIAHKAGATPGQIALAWLLRRSPVMLPIAGTSKVKHLQENVAAAHIKLSDQDYAALQAL
jgi:aryl-alcohol dehydrogenase-like predicted oxidoreductase